MRLPWIEELRHSVVRDLAWVLRAPNLAADRQGGAVISDAECAGLLSAHRAELEAFDRDPSELLAWLESQESSPLLGRYFEQLLGFWIQRLLRARRFAHSLKLSREKQVVGELDFVFEDVQGMLKHWEVSVKFYLCTAEDSEGGTRADAFLGTMTRDRLDKKLARLFERQLEAPASPEGKAALRAAGFAGGPLESHLLMKGALFYPSDRDWRTHPSPPEASPRHLRGWWSKELPPGDAWVVLDRRRWLSPFLAVEPGFAPLSRAGMLARLAAHFGEARTAFMLAALERGGDGLWREAHRGLVVHPGWPWPLSGSSRTSADRALDSL